MRPGSKLINCRLLVRKPGPFSISLLKPSNKMPETTNSNTDNATCAPTITLRPHSLLPFEAVPSFSFRAVMRSNRVVWTAGARPKTKVLAIPTKNVNNNALPLRWKLISRGASVGIGIVLRNVSAPYATASPAAAPKRDKTKFSTSNWRIKVQRPAPTASFRAISRARMEARLRSNPATFAQATRSTQRASNASMTTNAVSGGSCST
jgi:hypothetical protein